jgi:flagellar motor switch/type III secretory pathway protein FliN
VDGHGDGVCLALPGVDGGGHHHALRQVEPLDEAFDHRLGVIDGLVPSDEYGDERVSSGLVRVHVEVTVELATQSVSLEALAAWGVGAVVEFPQRLGETVVVRAGGRAVARGELVNVEGQVGVRITALS